MAELIVGSGDAVGDGERVVNLEPQNGAVQTEGATNHKV